MKKFYSFLVAAVLLMGATSCQKEATADAGAADNVEFVASIAGGRTELGDGNKVMWNDSDNIRIFTQENFAGTVFNSNIEEEEVTATAKFTTTKSFTASNNGYLAVYPETANTGNATCENGVWSIPVNIQGWNQNPVNYPIAFEQNAFMVAFSGDNQLSFKAATALLKIKNVDNSQYGEIHFSGDILGGEATLLYDTNTAEISYTLGNGDSMVQYSFPEQNGETIYIPIYPGTVTGFEVYGDDYLNPLVTYNKEITFKAGVIYDLDLDNAPISGGNNSPYSLFNGQEWIPMTIENGFHVAKNVRFAEYGYWITEGQSTSYEVSGNITMGTWMELVQGMNTGIIFEADYADFYMTEDASMLCIVPAGTPFENLPALPTYEPSPYYLLNMDTETLTPMIIKDGYHFAKKVDNSDEGYAVVTEDMSVTLGFTAEWADPGVWYKSGAFDGTTYKTLPIASYQWQPASVYLSADAGWLCVTYPGYELPALPQPEPEYEEITITAYNYSGWADSEVYVYAISGDEVLSDAEPGTKMTVSSAGVLTATLSVLKSAAPETIQFSFNNGTAQTAKSEAFAYATEYTFYFTASKVLTEKPLLQIKVYNKVGWSKVNCYAWDPSVAGANYLAVWPGTAMEKEGDWYVYTLDEKYRGKQLSFIFNDGDNQTHNLEFVYMDDTRHFRVDVAKTAVAITPENKEAKPGVTIYVKNTANWNPLKIYSWNDSDQPQSGSWSGTQMTATETINGVTYKKYAFTNYDNTKGLHVILNNGSKQTNNIDVGKFGEPMFINVKGDRSHEVIADPRH